MLVTVISFILVLGFLVLIHELGHFLVAKWLGVKVEKFSIGFGPKIASFTKGETQYMISALPLGGYVKMTGEEPDEELTNDPREFGSRPVSHRMAIIIAGPLMNLFLTFVLLPIVFMMGVNMPAYLQEKVEVGWVMDDSPAKDSSLQPGDLIRSIDGEDVETWEEAITIFTSSPGRILTLNILRGSRELKIDLVPRAMDSDGGGYSGIIQPMEPVIAEVNPGMPAGKAGLKKGDIVRYINGREVSHWIEMSDLIKEAAGNEVRVSVLRDGRSLDVTLTPVTDEASGKRVIGITYSQHMELIKFGFAGAVKEGFRRAFDLTYLTFGILKKLFTLDLSIKSLGGPIMIAQATGAAAQSGLSELISLMAFISLQLGVLNLLPIPVLDGGHVFFLSAEMALRRPISIKTREIAQQIGFAILILLMLIVSYNDIMRVLPF